MYILRREGLFGQQKGNIGKAERILRGTWAHHRSTWTDQRDFRADQKGTWTTQSDTQADQRVMGQCEEHLGQQETLGLSRGVLAMMTGALNPTRGTLDTNHRGTEANQTRGDMAEQTKKELGGQQGHIVSTD